MDEKFCEAAGYLPSQLKNLLRRLPEQLQGSVREICLRAERPLVVSTFGGEYFADSAGGFHRLLPASPLIVSRDELSECVRILTEYSLHSYVQEINAGFITVRGGHRAGVSGSCVTDGERIVSVGNLSSVNLRVARQVKGCAVSLVRELYRERVGSTLIVGPPASGKTTLLRDMARCLANGEPGYYTRLSLIDERGELAAVSRGVPQNDVGVLTDVFDGYRKGEGMAIAIRSMSPAALILDEIATEADADSIRQSLNAGVAVIVSTHAATLEELCRKRHIRSLLSEGAFANVVLLKSAAEPCRVERIIRPKFLSSEREEDLLC